MNAARCLARAALLLVALGSLACSSESGDTSSPSGTDDASTTPDSGAGLDAGVDADAAVVQDAAPDIAQPEAGPADSGADAPADAPEDIAAQPDGPAAEDSVSVGGSCQDSIECKGNAECVSGAGGTPAHCTPLCDTNADCVDPIQGYCGMCQSAGTFSFCVFVCGNLGAAFVPECTVTPACPEGPLTCDGVMCG